MRAKTELQAQKFLSLLRGLEQQRAEMALALAMNETQAAQAALTEAEDAAVLAQAGWRRSILAGGPVALTTARLWAAEAHTRDAQRLTCDQVHEAARDEQALRQDETALALTRARSAQRQTSAAARRWQGLREERALAELSDRFTRRAPSARRA